MITLAFISQKGGAGKTTLAIHLAGCALRHGLKTALIDTDPQRSIQVWAMRRAHSQPTVWARDTHKLSQTLEQAKKKEYELVILDTPARANKQILEVAKLANMVVIPSRPALFDLHAMEDSIEMVKSLKKKAALVLNGSPPPRKSKIKQSIGKDAKHWMNEYGLPVYPMEIAQRAPFSHALINGQTIQEYEPNGKASNEIQALWRWIQPLIGDSENRSS